MPHSTKTLAPASSLLARQLAATAVSYIFNKHDIPHAFIGGLPLNLLGHTRYGSDIDVLVDETAFCGEDIRKMKPHLVEILVKHDDRFTTTNGALMHLHFHATIGEDAVEVPVETLPAGQLALPLRLEDVEKIGVSQIPILPPELFFITKAKRAAALIGSSRPKSVARLAHDEQDLDFLLRWMGQHGRIIDIHRYCSLLERQQNTQAQSVLKNRLYKQLRDLYLYWSAKEHQGSGQAEAFKNVIATIDQAYFQEK